MLPPSVCSLLESPEFFSKIVHTEVTPRSCPGEGNNMNNCSCNNRYTQRYRDIDMESVIISMLLEKDKQVFLSSSMSRRAYSLNGYSPIVDTSLPKRSSTSVDHRKLFNEDVLTAVYRPDVTLLSQSAGIIGWLSGGKMNRSKYLESAIHMTLLPFLNKLSVYH